MDCTKDKSILLLFLAILEISFLLMSEAGITSAVAVIQSQKNGSSKSYHVDDDVHPVVKSICAATLYPDLCVSAIANDANVNAESPAASGGSTVTTPKDVLLVTLNQTIKNVQHSYDNITGIITGNSSVLLVLTRHEKLALEDCLVTLNDTLAELRKTSGELTRLPVFFEEEEKKKKKKKKDKKIDDYSLHQQIEQVKILISAAMTNQETCLDEFNLNKAEKEFRQKSLDGQLLYVFRSCSNLLAMVKNLTSSAADVDHNYKRDRKKLVEEKQDRYYYDDDDDDSSSWPHWLTAGDRRLLQGGGGTGTTTQPDVTVAADGSGNYRTVSEAVAAAPAGSQRRYIIKIKAGVYRENVEIPRSKTNLMFIGDGQKNTIITARRNVKEGSTTFRSATVAVAGDGFLGRDIAFQNTAGPEGEQAVALRVNADLTAFYKCDMIGYQDTLYVHSLRQFYHSCYIAGTVDFIFGNAAVVFQNCDIHARKPGPNQKNMVTAQGRDDPNQNTGIVIQRCRIGATNDLQAEMSKYPTYLGRPWKQYSRTVVMVSDIGNVIQPAGWFEWNGNFALDTLYYGEYRNTGAGSGTSNRVKWKGYKVITDLAEAEGFSPQNFLSGSSWLGSTGFPYTLGL